MTWNEFDYILYLHVPQPARVFFRKIYHHSIIFQMLQCPVTKGNNSINLIFTVKNLQLCLSGKLSSALILVWLEAWELRKLRSYPIWGLKIQYGLSRRKNIKIRHTIECIEPNIVLQGTGEKKYTILSIVQVLSIVFRYLITGWKKVWDSGVQVISAYIIL